MYCVVKKAACIEPEVKHFVFFVKPLQNVVVVNQPSAAPQTIHVVHNRANDHMVLTLVMMVLCFLHGNLPAFICLIPALIFAMVVSIM